MWLVSAHYRKPIGFSEEALAQAEAERAHAARAGPPPGPRGARRTTAMDALVERFFDALADDFNTPEARAVLFEWVARGQSPARRRRARSGRGACARCSTRSAWSGSWTRRTDEAPDEVRELADGARPARAARDFAEADRLRDELAERGWEVRDTPDGARLVRSG